MDVHILYRLREHQAIVVYCSQVVFKNTIWVMQPANLAAEAVQCAALSLESIHYVQGCHRLSAGMLGVSDCITDDVLEEHLQHAASLLIYQTTDSLDTSAASQAANGRLCDALNVVSQDLAVTLGTTFAKALASFSTSRHVC
jgi:hypothetical protein